MVKHNAGLALPNDDFFEDFQKLANGQLYKVSVTKPRNYQFHKKFFSLLQAGYELWEPPRTPTDWGTPEKDFETFRNDVTCLAGFRKLVFKANGEFRMVAESISFAKMDETRFQLLYNKVHQVILDTCCPHISESELDEATNRIMGYL